MDNRFLVAQLLAEKPGRAVAEAANAALNAGTAEALYQFLFGAFEKAQREDDAVATATLLRTGGPYTKAHAQAVLEGPSWMRRKFIANVQFETAQLDHDFATHVAAMQGAIAAAAKIADKAQEDAARAQEAAANARKAGGEAQMWAGKAVEAAGRATASAQKADAYANQAEESARNAQASADKAKQQAAAARTASRSANYSANRALESARSARKSADWAKESATKARTSAILAGRNAIDAATAASEVRLEAKQKRDLENTAAAELAANKMASHEIAKTNPADTAENDSTLFNPSKKDWQDWSHTSHDLAFLTGTVAAYVGFAAALSGNRVVGFAALGLSSVTVGLDVWSAFCAYKGFGWESEEFESASRLALFSVFSLGVGSRLRAVNSSISHRTAELTNSAFDAWGAIMNRMTAH
ncbi:hypothetical protein ABT237_39170 [Streptomyces sp. NPDC001581]|uniref:hypothetical protein n=1 Tax=Streptomyces sp. NPDC001581 TaxID=3154386 RepID=UPI00332514F3